MPKTKCHLNRHVFGNHNSNNITRNARTLTHTQWSVQLTFQVIRPEMLLLLSIYLWSAKIDSFMFKFFSLFVHKQNLWLFEWLTSYYFTHAIFIHWRGAFSYICSCLKSIRRKSSQRFGFPMQNQKTVTLASNDTMNLFGVLVQNSFCVCLVKSLQQSCDKCD